jgi:hypothetical protein
MSDHDYEGNKIFAALRVFSDVLTLAEISLSLRVPSGPSMLNPALNYEGAYWVLRTDDFSRDGPRAVENAIVSLIERVPLTGRQWLLSRVSEGTVRARITVFLGIGSRELHMSSGLLQRLADLQLDVKLDIYARD